MSISFMAFVWTTQEKHIAEAIHIKEDSLINFESDFAIRRMLSHAVIYQMLCVFFVMLFWVATHAWCGIRIFPLLNHWQF